MPESLSRIHIPGSLLKIQTNILAIHDTDCGCLPEHALLKQGPEDFTVIFWYSTLRNQLVTY